MRTQMLFALALVSSVAMATPDKVINIVCNETSVGQFVDKDGNAQKIEKSISGSTAVRKISVDQDGSKSYTLEGKVFYNGAVQSTYHLSGTIQTKKISDNIRQRTKVALVDSQMADPDIKYSNGQSHLLKKTVIVDTIETKADGSEVVTQETVDGKVQPTDTNFTLTGMDGTKYAVAITDKPYEQKFNNGSKYKVLSSKSICTETTKDQSL